MDACDIDPERIDACVFMAATVDGPISMCAYNAERDIYLLKPIQRANGSLWQALAAAADRNGEVRLPVKWLKVKSRATVKAASKETERCRVNSPASRARIAKRAGRASLAVIALAALFVVGCTTLVPLPEESRGAPATLLEAEAGYACVLEQHVNERGQVAFEALRDEASSRSGLPALERYVRAIGRTAGWIRQ